MFRRETMGNWNLLTLSMVCFNCLIIYTHILKIYTSAKALNRELAIVVDVVCWGNLVPQYQLTRDVCMHFECIRKVSTFSVTSKIFVCVTIQAFDSSNYHIFLPGDSILQRFFRESANNINSLFYSEKSVEIKWIRWTYVFEKEYR